MRIEEVLEIARAGAAAGCREALFTLGDKPELRYRGAREELAELGFATTLDYLREAARAVLDETGLLPHLNPGLMTRADIAALRSVSASMGIMLETTATRLSERGGPHRGAPDKDPALRLETIRLAGELNVPFTSGILIGIGETRAERLDALRALSRLAEEHGHLQEVIVQNFRAKPGTRMAAHPEPDTEDHLWTIAAARMLLPPSVHVQAPPNLAFEDFPRLLDAGIDDWGGVSPVTVDHVNPEAPWPDLERLAAATSERGLTLVPRLPLYPEHVLDIERWVDPAVAPTVRRATDSMGLAREDPWSPGEPGDIPAALRPPALIRVHARAGNPGVAEALARARAGEPLGEDDAIALLRARGDDRVAALAAADEMRREVCGDDVTYVVTRNIQYTNVCYFRCGFCAFSKGRLAADLRGKPYLVPLDEVVRRAEEAWERGAVEVCLQGGIHPAFDGDYYAAVVEAIRDAVPDIHVHAFSALEIWQGAATLDVSLEDYLIRLRDLGLSSLPGTAAEILDDEVRRVLCPDKIDTEQWLEVHDTAHRVGLRSNVTMMFGHVDGPRNWARHLLQRRLHGVRPTAVRAHGGADLASRAGALGPHLRRDAARPRRRATCPASGDHEHPGVLGEARPGGDPRHPGRRGQRPGRDAHERVDLTRRRLGARAGDAARAHGGGDPLEPAPARSAYDSVRDPAGQPDATVVRSGSARRAAQPAGTRGGTSRAARARAPRSGVTGAHWPDARLDTPVAPA
jgi:FO synthase